MKVAIVVTHYMYPDVIGGAEIFTYKLALFLAKRGHEVHLLAFRGSKFISRRFGKLFFHAIPRPLIPLGKTIARLFFAICLMRIKPDAVLSVFIDSALPVLAYSCFFRGLSAIRFVGVDVRILEKVYLKKKLSTLHISERSIWAKIYWNVIVNLIKRYVKNRKILLIALNNDMRSSLVKVGFPDDAIFIIPNFVDGSFFKCMPNYNGNVIGFVGRLVFVKGIDILLNAFSIVRNEIGDAFLLLVGDGAMREEILKQAKKLNCSEYVKVTGFVSNNEVPKYLSEMAVFVLPSRHEGTPNALLQAMAAGLPIVATSVGGVPQLIKHGKNGLLVPPENSEALAKAIIFLLKNKELAKKLGLQAHKDAKQYSVDRIVKVYEKILNLLRIT